MCFVRVSSQGPRHISAQRLLGLSAVPGMWSGPVPGNPGVTSWGLGARRGASWHSQLHLQAGPPTVQAESWKTVPRPPGQLLHRKTLVLQHLTLSAGLAIHAAITGHPPDPGQAQALTPRSPQQDPPPTRHSTAQPTTQPAG